MATKKKLLQAAAGSAGGAGGLNVEEVFSTYLYEGTGSTQRSLMELILMARVVWFGLSAVMQQKTITFTTRKGVLLSF